MKTRVFLVVLNALCIVYVSSEPSVDDCAEYVLEGHDLNCTCEALNCNSTNVKVTWPGHSDTAELAKVNVSREETSLDFTCRMECEGEVSSTNYSVEVFYPPTEAPVIQGYTGQLMKAGDTLSCSVTGGNPLVTAVIFYCIDPKLEDLEDNVRNTSVTSVLVVNTSQATADNMTCYCTANWSPVFNMYTLQDSITAQTEYKAELDRFLLNGASEHLTVSENETYLAISCAAKGRPAPNLELIFEGHTDPVNLTDQASSNGTFGRVLSYDIPTAGCQHMGVYMCVAHNGFANPSSERLLLNVNCTPRLLYPDNSRDSLPELRETGLHFSLLAYPTSTSFNFSIYRDKTNATGEQVPSDWFSVEAEQIKHSSRISLSLREIAVPEDHAGLYGVSVSNGLGEVQLFYEVIKQVKPNITVFSLNDTPGQLTVQENDTNITVICQATGQPSPNLTLTFEADLQPVTLEGQQTETESYTRALNHVVSMATCGRMGTYRCSADNGYLDADKASVLLNINCGPRFPADVSPGTSKTEPALLTDNGLSFSLLAHPLPETALYTVFVSNQTNTLSEDFFSLRLSQVKSSCVVECSLTISKAEFKQLQEKYSPSDAILSVRMSNAFGTAAYFFKLQEKDGKEPADPAAVSEAVVRGVAGGVAGAAVVVVVIVIIMIILVKRRRKMTAGTILLQSVSLKEKLPHQNSDSDEI